jgi:DNA-directed RNA polymerase specialized sigma24 family protein
MGTKEQELEIVACSKFARNLVKQAVGFYDVDLEQDAIESMIIASQRYKVGSKASHKTWIITKAKWGIIDAYRQRTHRTHGEFKPDKYKKDISMSDLPETLEPNDSLVKVNFKADVERFIEKSYPHSLRSRTILYDLLNGYTGAEAARKNSLTESAVCRIFTKFKGEYSARASRL